MAFLELRNLSCTFFTEYGPVQAVRKVDLKVLQKSSHALVGQTGAGKSILALSLVRLLPENAEVTGSALYGDLDLLTCSEKALRALRGKEIMMVFQNPLTSLNPVLPIGKQLCEIPMYHQGLSYSASKTLAEEMLSICGLKDAPRIMQAHPFEMSGGMLQRVAIAMGIMCRPALLIADEPMKGLDVTLQKEIARTLARVCRDLEITLLMITHNLKVAESICDTVSVMHEGCILETVPVGTFFSDPQHPYSKKLVRTYGLFSQ
jgi:peptide/nickel transport system ATP-binding protein